MSQSEGTFIWEKTLSPSDFGEEAGSRLMGRSEHHGGFLAGGNDSQGVLQMKESRILSMQRPLLLWVRPAGRGGDGWMLNSSSRIRVVR